MGASFRDKRRKADPIEPSDIAVPLGTHSSDLFSSASTLKCMKQVAKINHPDCLTEFPVPGICV
jgi:hypothetical protein